MHDEMDDYKIHMNEVDKATKKKLKASPRRSLRPTPSALGNNPSSKATP